MGQMTKTLSNKTLIILFYSILFIYLFLEYRETFLLFLGLFVASRR